MGQLDDNDLVTESTTSPLSANYNNDGKIRKIITVASFNTQPNDSFIKITSSSFEFKITDDKNSIQVKYDGILPDLFREGQGAVIDGYFKNNKLFIAKNVFAKHDENYMPSSIKSDLKNSGYWKKNY